MTRKSHISVTTAVRAVGRLTMWGSEFPQVRGDRVLSKLVEAETTRYKIKKKKWHSKQEGDLMIQKK